MHLATSGYGTVDSISEWDTDQFLNALEHSAISSAIARHFKWKSENGID